MKRLPISNEALARLCQAHYIRRFALFGSQLADMFRPDGDIDLLVKFGPSTYLSCAVSRRWRGRNSAPCSAGAMWTRALRES